MNDKYRTTKIASLILARNLIYALVGIVLIGWEATASADQTPSLGQTITVPLDYKVPNLEAADHSTSSLAHPTKEQNPRCLSSPTRSNFMFGVERWRTLSVLCLAMPSTLSASSGAAFLKSLYVPRSTPTVSPTGYRHGKSLTASSGLMTLTRFVERLLAITAKSFFMADRGVHFLVHQYLAKYGTHVQRAFTQAALNPFIVNELRINSDHFWEEIGAPNRDLQSMLRSVLERRANERETIIMTLQRQNFFVPPEQSPARRADLIHALAAGDTRLYEEARKQYQVDAIQRLNNSSEGMPIRVRLYEFFYPSAARQRLGGEAIYPDLENQYNIAKKLVIFADAGKISSPIFNFAALHQLETEVFILTGRWDHTADYRSSIALAANYPRHCLFIANDNHTFENLNKSGDTNRILRAFLESGLSSGKMREALNTAEPLRWSE